MLTRRSPLSARGSRPGARAWRLVAPLALVAALCPAAATSAAGEGGTSIEGTLVRAYSEGSGPTDADVLLTWVQTGSDAVRISSDDVAALATGSTVRVRLGAGAPTGDAEVTAGAGALAGEPARDVLSAQVLAPPAGAGASGYSLAGTAADADPPLAAAGTTEHGVTVVMAVPRGGTRDATTLAQVTGALNGPVSDYWSSQTGGRVHLSVTGGVDWTTLSAGCDDPLGMWNQAAAAAHWTPGPDRHLLVYLSTAPSSLTGCAAGLAEVGSSIDYGGRLYVRAEASVLPSVMAHELGHNLGLRHAATLQCDGTLEGPDSACQRTTYRDYYDVMGASWGTLSALSGFQATQLGVMDPSARREVSPAGGAGVVTLAPVGATSGVRAVRLVDGAGATYWIEYRAPVGRDAYLGTSGNWLHLDSGVVVRREGGAGQDATYLLDGTPSPRSGWGSDNAEALRPGTTVALGSGGWYLTVRAAGGTATVDVRRGAAATPDTPPLVPLLPVQRFQGATRYDTAAKIATAAHPTGASTVVVASGQDFPDALAAGPSAAQSGAALLLVPTSGPLPAAVTSALAALAPSAITVVGGPASVGDDVLAQLSATAPATRVAGPDRYGTAAAVALAGDPGTGGTVYLASGTGYADALAGGALAAGSGGRLLLTAADALPEVTAEAIVDLHPAHLVLLGGAGTVADEVGAAAAGASPGATVDRWSGSDRYATAAAAATRGYSAGASTVYLASGTNFPDAVAGGPAAGGARAPLLLTQPGCTPAATLAAVKALGATRVVVLGGLGSVSERAADLAIC